MVNPQEKIRFIGVFTEQETSGTTQMNKKMTPTTEARKQNKGKSNQTAEEVMTHEGTSRVWWRGSGKLSCGLKKSEILLGNPGSDWIHRIISLTASVTNRIGTSRNLKSFLFFFSL